MTAVRVEDRETPTPLPDLFAALAEGFSEILGSEFPSAQSMAAAAAQLCLESGNGQHAHCWNYHNEKRASDWDGLYCSYKCDEIFDAQTALRAKALGPCSSSPWRGGPLYRVVLMAEHPWAEFVAFSSAAQGTARYIEFLSCRDRYRAAWHALYAGDAAAFSHELRRAGYYTADESAYTKGLVSIAQRSLPACENILAAKGHGLSIDEEAQILSIVGLTMAETYWQPDRHMENAA